MEDITYRMKLVEQNVGAIAERLVTFNAELATGMEHDLVRRKRAISKAQRAREMLNLPEVDSPRNEEIGDKMRRLSQQLINRTISPPNNQQDISGSIEIAHVLFIDLVGYSNLPSDKQTDVLRVLQDAVRTTNDFGTAIKANSLVALPTGDGMALAFFRDPLSPVRCAVELSRLSRNTLKLQLRMGLNSGLVYLINDINRNKNLAGEGINRAESNGLWRRRTHPCIETPG
jgi:class 3 adenylate cyclase